MLVLKLDDGARSNQLRVAKCETMSDELCKEDQGAVYHRVMSLAGRQRWRGFSGDARRRHVSTAREFITRHSCPYTLWCRNFATRSYGVAENIYCCARCVLMPKWMYAW